MKPSIPETMKAAAIDRFGGPEVIHTRSLPVPKPGAYDVLIRLDTAGIGVWDPYVREGEIPTAAPNFPRVIGNDGAGTVVAAGERVTRFRVGERVYAYSMDGGFYAEYVAVSEDNVAPVPPGVKQDEAGALGADGVTALRGLEDELQLERGQTLMIFGASGGIGHLAVQLAKRIGARVLAVASGPDGVELVRRLGADTAIDGRNDDVTRASLIFAPGGLDAALVLTHGPGLVAALRTVKQGGRVAYPNGVEPEPQVPDGIESHAYDGTPEVDAFNRLNRLIGSARFHVELGRVYRLEDAAVAHREIEEHHIGKLALRVH
ncbi:MAG TPA: NADP-dependent oxidoreductase [Polyangia bacterium]|jgi:NADPH:quinone reductase-like Zn-dependent oxidoreductase|nr:NADP-dependent oxidoreductase [Polyangia bacterium]